MGYVYFLRETVTNTIKIGKSKKVYDRIGVLSVQLPFEVNEEFIIITNFHDKLERLFHEIFDSKRVNGEWFALDEEELEMIKKGDYNALIDKLGITYEPDVTKALLKIYAEDQKIIVRKDRMIRVNVSLDGDMHSKLKNEAFKQEMTKTTLGAEIIKVVLSDENILNQVKEKMCS